MSTARDRGAARRLDLGIDRLVSDAVHLGEPRKRELLTTVVADARRSPIAPDWLRNVRGDGLTDTLTKMLDDYAELVHPTHGEEIVTALLADAPRSLPEPHGASLIGCFDVGGHTVLAGLQVRRDGSSLQFTDAFEHHPMPVRPEGAEDAAGATDVEVAAARDLVVAAARLGVRAVEPVLRMTVAVDADTRADAVALLVAAGAVARTDVRVVVLPDPMDTFALSAFKSAAVERSPQVITVWSAQTHGWFFRWAGSVNARLLPPLHGAAADAADLLFAALLPLARELQRASSASGELTTRKVALDKVGGGGAQGDKLLLAKRECPHRRGSRRRVPNAEAKVKGAKNLEGLPPGAVFKSLEMCGDMGCTLCWAVYRVPVGSGWPPGDPA